MPEPSEKNGMDGDNQRTGPIRMWLPKEVVLVVLGEDHLGRRIMKRGTKVFIEIGKGD